MTAENVTTPTDDELMLDALERAGVDNWDWYDDSLAELTAADFDDASIVVEALRSGGVDDWDGYGYALEHYHELRREHVLDTDNDDDDAPMDPFEDEGATVNEEVEQTVAEDMALSERRLRNILEDKYDADGKAVWKANYAPKVYNKALKTLVKGVTFEEVRNNYLDLLYGKDAGLA